MLPTSSPGPFVLRDKLGDKCDIPSMTNLTFGPCVKDVVVVIHFIIQVYRLLKGGCTGKRWHQNDENKRRKYQKDEEKVLQKNSNIYVALVCNIFECC